MTAVDLEAVKARAAEPGSVLEWASHYADEYIGALQESQEDVLKLVALIEKIRDDAAETADQYQATSDRLWQEVTDRKPNRSLDDALRYGSYAAATRATVDKIERTIEEGLTS